MEQQFEELLPTDFRIGNLIYIPQLKGEYKIGSIEQNGRFTTFDYKHSFSCLECLVPILVNEERMLKMGFDKNENGDFKIFKHSEVEIIIKKDFRSWQCDGINFSVGKLDYVHQIQNLMYSLGSEVTVL